MEPLKSNGSITQGKLKNWTGPLMGNQTPGYKCSRTKNHRFSLIPQSPSIRATLLCTLGSTIHIVFHVLCSLELSKVTKMSPTQKKNVRTRKLLFAPLPARILQYFIQTYIQQSSVDSGISLDSQFKMPENSIQTGLVF